MMMIMVYALHDEKEEREILKKIKILFILIKGTSTVLFYNLCDGFYIIILVELVLIIFY